MHAIMYAPRLHRQAGGVNVHVYTVASSVPDIHVYVSVDIEAEVL